MGTRKQAPEIAATCTDARPSLHQVRAKGTGQSRDAMSDKAYRAVATLAFHGAVGKLDEVFKGTQALTSAPRPGAETTSILPPSISSL